MIYFKACPRCKGDVYAYRDHFGAFKSCLQCGYCEDMVPMQRLARVDAILQEVTRVQAD